MKEKVQTGLRIPEERYQELFAISDRAGISINALVLALVELGMNVIRLGTEESLRSLLRNPTDTGEGYTPPDC